MTQLVSNKREWYMSEYALFNGCSYTIFNIVDINEFSKEVTVGVSHEGRLSTCTFPLLENENGLYFEYGVRDNKVFIDEFEIMED